jgi:hypothetical protein
MKRARGTDLTIMRKNSFRRLRAGLAVAAGLLLAGCVTDYLPEPGKGPPAVSPTKAFSMGEAPIKGDAARFSFTPVTGLPMAFANELNDSLKENAAKRSITIVPEGDPTATYVVKGYVSAIGDRQGTLLVYVWDVFDLRGNRLHRYSGQAPGGGAVVDPWRGIKAATVSAAARNAIDDLKAWSD